MFLLLDLETTGLDPGKCAIIEVAARLLRHDEEVARYHVLCSTPPIQNGAWEQVALEMHVKSGLLEEARDHGILFTDAEKALVELLDEHMDKDEPVYLMGNSIHFDRGFLVNRMPRLMDRLHYRQLDVTSVRLWFELMSGDDPYLETPKPHRAEDDIDNSLKQAQHMWQLKR